MEKVWQAPLISRSIRRFLVLGCYFGYLGLIIAWIFLPQPIRSIFTLLIGLFSILCFAALLMPNLIGVSDGQINLLDERQQQFRQMMYPRAYQILSGIFLLVCLYVFIAADAEVLWLPKTELERQAVFYGIFLVISTLPTALIAWLEPDSPSEH